MRTNGQGLVLAGCLWAATAFTAPEKAPLVLRVFNDFYPAAELGISLDAAECRQLEPLTKAVIGPLFADYYEKSGISVSEEDLKEYCRRQLSDQDSFTETWAEWTPNGSQWKARQEALTQLTVWKLQKSLFDQYGGRVIRSDGAPPQAFDAMFAYLVEREKAGDFTLYDEQLKLRFWVCLRTPKDPLVPEEEGRSLIEEHPADRQKRLRQAEP